MLGIAETQDILFGQNFTAAEAELHTVPKKHTHNHVQITTQRIRQMCFHAVICVFIHVIVSFN